MSRAATGREGTCRTIPGALPAAGPGDPELWADQAEAEEGGGRPLRRPARPEGAASSGKEPGPGLSMMPTCSPRCNHRRQHEPQGGVPSDHRPHTHPWPAPGSPASCKRRARRPSCALGSELATPRRRRRHHLLLQSCPGLREPPTPPRHPGQLTPATRRRGPCLWPRPGRAVREDGSEAQPGLPALSGGHRSRLGRTCLLSGGSRVQPAAAFRHRPTRVAHRPDAMAALSYGHVSGLSFHKVPIPGLGGPTRPGSHALPAVLGLPGASTELIKWTARQPRAEGPGFDSSQMARTSVACSIPRPRLGV